MALDDPGRRGRSTRNESIPKARHPRLEASDRSALDDALVTGFAKIELSVEPAARSKLVDLAILVSRWAIRMNLTGHRESRAILDSLVIDALGLWHSLRPLLGRTPAGRIADLGSGAGFPGLPIAIIEQGLEIELVESRQRRHHFQRTACRELGLENVAPRLGRIEEIEATPSDLALAQAVGPIEEVVVLAMRWVRPGGWLAIPCGPEVPDFDPGPHWQETTTRPYSQLRPGQRTVWIARRAQ